ncbi:cell filamentation protein Fic [Shewanella algicola]|uniref:protein adenylyltransferase n=1 Tax=Shewanella algicola TaxID=640633 RepID=A0A9X1ZA62_9GAMM|nr:Fic family protein [Shewanella algicola]MCL1106487.1 Fic family protein [Shewanella algicola]GGP67622.1 cell filamentation protein Fic [Shewanella algicola]
MQDKYGVIQDSYCYPESDVLINKLNITNHDELTEAELEFTAFRYSEYSSSITSLSEFDLNHFKGLHFHLFQDVYDWAGKLRMVDISKGNTRFCTCSRVEAELNKQLSRIHALDWGNPKASFFHDITDIFCELNVVHPFREGNGRTQRFFFEELYFFLGKTVHWPDISKDEWINANVKGYHGDLNPLHNILTQAIS